MWLLCFFRAKTAQLYVNKPQVSLPYSKEQTVTDTARNQRKTHHTKKVFLVNVEKSSIKAYSALYSTKNLRFFNWNEATNKELGTEGLNWTNTGRFTINKLKVSTPKKPRGRFSSGTKTNLWRSARKMQGTDDINLNRAINQSRSSLSSQMQTASPMLYRIPCYGYVCKLGPAVKRPNYFLIRSATNNKLLKTLFNEIRLTLTCGWSRDNYNSETDREKEKKVLWRHFMFSCASAGD